VSDIFQFDNHDHIADDDIGPTIKHSSIPDELWKCIQTALDSKNLEPSSLSHLTIGGRTYSTSTKHLGNSHILLKSANGIPGQMIPARIDYITQVMVPSDSSVIYIAARKYLPVKLAHDPFREHLCLQAELWSECLSELYLYRLDLIETHFASLPISWEGQRMMVVISLKRVSLNSLPIQVRLVHIFLYRSCDHDADVDPLETWRGGRMRDDGFRDELSGK
jgi:hypothetical protein